jgi:cytidyltransferase-like protein
LKKKPGGFFTQGAVEQFNILVREISEYLNRKNIVVESMIPTFDQFRKEKKVFVPQEETESDDEEEVEQEVEEIPIEAEEEEKEEFQEIEVGPESEVDPEIVNRIKSILNTDHHREIPSTDDNSVNLVIGKFHPFNNGHLKLIKKANQHNGLPVCVFVAKPKKEIIDQETVRKMMHLVADELSGIISSINYVDDDLLATAIDNLDKSLVPKTLTVGKKRLDNYLLQSRSLKRKSKLPEDFNVQGAPEWVTSSMVNNSLKEKNYLEF